MPRLAGISDQPLLDFDELEADDGIHIGDYVRAVRRRFWLIALITVLVALIAAVYMAQKDDIYEAKARVQVDLEINPGVGAARDGAVIVSSPINDPAYFNTQLQILTGSGLLRRVVKTMDLENNPDFLHPRAARSLTTWQKLKQMVGLGSRDQGDKPAMSIDDVRVVTGTMAPPVLSDDLAEAKQLAPYVLAIQRDLKVEPVSVASMQTRLIDIRYSHPDPRIATKVVNAIADSLVLTNLENKTVMTTSAGQFLQQRIAQLQDRIRLGEEQLLNYTKSNQILSLDPAQNTVVERLATLNRQLLEAENARTLAEAAYRAVLVPGAAEAMVASGSAQMSAPEAKLAELQQQRAQLMVENTEEWPAVKELDQQIKVLEKQIGEAKNRSIMVMKTNLETSYRQALTREQTLRAAFEKQRERTLALNEAAINYKIIQQEIDTNKALLASLLQKAKENELVRAGTSNNIHVVDYALGPGTFVGPQRLQGVGMATLLAFSCGVGLVVLLEYFDKTLRSAEEIEKLLRLPVLGSIPSADKTNRSLQLTNGQKFATLAGKARPALLIEGDTRSPLAEAYRRLRTSVLLSRSGGAPRTVLVTSTNPAEGKTTTAVNTAISLAQTGAKVLIIDGDLRHSCIHEIFSLKNERGLSNILTSNMSEVEILSLIEQHENSGVYVLPAGPAPPNPADLLGTDQMRELITKLEAAFTYIVIDSPPIIFFSDSVLIATMVDGVLLVVREGKSARDEVKSSRKLLQDVGAKVYGVVLNEVKMVPRRYHYYPYYTT
jgi:capsular exopolysaccharide synthesis family protein